MTMVPAHAWMCVMEPSLRAITYLFKKAKIDKIS